MLKAREVLLYFSLLYEGDYEKAYAAITRRELIDLDLARQLKANLKACFCTIVDDDYPPNLKNIPNPPLVLYYYGNFSLLRHKALAVIGSREATGYGTAMCRKIIGELAKEKELAIISGLARGIDIVAHLAAIEVKGKTIAILGSGIDNCYPKDNKRIYELMKNEHLIISEYPNMVVPDKSHFPSRNRIIAGLSSAIFVVEAYERSGTLITVAYGLEIGKDIFCLPFPASSRSICNRLIKEGAVLVENSQDILEEMRFVGKKFI